MSDNTKSLLINKNILKKDFINNDLNKQQILNVLNKKTPKDLQNIQNIPKTNILNKLSSLKTIQLPLEDDTINNEHS